MKSFFKDLFGGFIGSILGGILGVMGTLWALQIDYSVDIEAAVMELISTQQIIESLYKEEPFYPTYKLLNYDVNWRRAILMSQNQELREMVTDLKKLDELRNIILQTQDHEQREMLIIQYKKELDFYKNSGFINKRIEEVQEQISNEDFQTGFFGDLKKKFNGGFSE